MAQPDLTAASLMFGKLIDTQQQRAEGSPVDSLLIRAQAAGVALTVDDIDWTEGEPDIDGMPADQWVDAMTMD